MKRKRNIVNLAYHLYMARGYAEKMKDKKRIKKIQAIMDDLLDKMNEKEETELVESIEYNRQLLDLIEIKGD